MLYKQAWQELKEYIKAARATTTSWDSLKDSRMRDKILKEIKRLEKRWKIIPDKRS